MQVRKTQLRALGLVLVMALITVACGTDTTDSSAGDGSPSGELSFMVAEYSPETPTFWENQIASFNEQYPDVTVNLEVVGWQQMHDTTANRIAANTLPDLVNTATIWLPEWIEAGALQTVGSSILSDELRNDFIPAVLTKGAEYEGELWGLPIAAAARDR